MPWVLTRTVICKYEPRTSFLPSSPRLPCHAIDMESNCDYDGTAIRVPEFAAENSFLTSREMRSSTITKVTKGLCTSRTRLESEGWCLSFAIDKVPC